MASHISEDDVLTFIYVTGNYISVEEKADVHQNMCAH